MRYNSILAGAKNEAEAGRARLLLSRYLVAILARREPRPPDNSRYITYLNVPLRLRSQMGDWIALDIGGANIKIANGYRHAQSFEFPLWKRPGQLRSELARILAKYSFEQLVVTMTGELADCFESKAQGVRAIVEDVAAVSDGRVARIYLTDGSFVTPDEAITQPQLAAASNWHALACYVGRLATRGTSLLIDIGSTTTDLIGLVDGTPANVGKDDTQRLVSGELVYTGVERSPICALLKQATYRGKICRIAQELFATTRDAYLLLGDLPEDAADMATADGRPATMVNARRRLGRMLCADVAEFADEDARLLASEVVRAQLEMLHQAATEVIDRLDGGISTVILSGHGTRLATCLLDRLQLNADVISLPEQLGNEISRCAPAHALATLARERLGNL